MAFFNPCSKESITQIGKELIIETVPNSVKLEKGLIKIKPIVKVREKTVETARNLAKIKQNIEAEKIKQNVTVYKNSQVETFFPPKKCLNVTTALKVATYNKHVNDMRKEYTVYDNLTKLKKCAFEHVQINIVKPETCVGNVHDQHILPEKNTTLWHSLESNIKLRTIQKENVNIILAHEFLMAYAEIDILNNIIELAELEFKNTNKCT